MWESATDLNKISLDLHKSDRKPRSPGGRIGTCQRSHLQSDRTHQMRKISRAKTFKSPRSERREEQYRGAALTRPRSAERHGRLCFGFGTRSSCRICPNITGGRSCFRPEICGQWRPFGLGSRTGWLRTHAHHHRSTSQAPLVGLTTFWGPSSSGGGSSGGQVTIPIAMSRRRHPGDPPAKEVTYRAGYRKLSREA